VRFQTWSIATALTFFLSNQAQAQVRDRIQTEPIEITAQSPDSVFSERAGDWPTSETSNSDLKPNSQPISETLNQVPGVQARDQGSPTISIRGSAQADRVLKLYEGIPLNFADGWGAANFFIPEESIGSLRILKGPSSVFFGPSAMAGAIDYRSRLFDQPFLRASTADDTGLLGRRSLFAALPIQKSQVTLFAEQAPQLYRYETPTGGNRRENNSTDTLRATFKSNWRVGETRIRPLLLVARQSGELPGATYSPYLSTFKMNGTLAAVESVTPLGNENDLSARLSDLRLWREDGDSSGFTAWTNARSMLSVDWRMTVSKWTARTFTDLRVDRLSASSLDARTESTAELGQTFDYAFAPEWSLQPGYRYLPKYGELVKAIGLQFTPPRTRAWIHYSEGFRNASLSDRFARFATFVPNEGLQPEKSKGGEVGFRFEQGRRFGGFLEGFAVGVVAHLTHYDNLFETANVSGGQITKINVGRAQTKGVEADAGFGYRVWTATVSHSYLEARNEMTGERLRLAPQNQTALTASTALGPALFELKETIWSSTVDRDLSNSPRDLAAWSTLDFNIRTIAMTDWEFRAGVFNIFDHPVELTYGYPEPQRRFYMSLGRSL
jgi:TonB dependent receptor/TonB-dependent Receptor Plug Domain